MVVGKSLINFEYDWRQSVGFEVEYSLTFYLFFVICFFPHIEKIAF